MLPLTFPPTKVLVRKRDGQVLGRDMLMKEDHFISGDRGSAFNFHLSGAPNFRQPFEGVFAVGQPTQHGSETVANLLSGESLKWICLRQEPGLYINGRSFVLREASSPFRNLQDLHGIDAGRLERMERKMKLELLAEAERFGGNVCLHVELGEGKLRACWEYITIDSVFTPQEAIGLLGPSIEFFRIPVSPCAAFEPRHIDLLLNIFDMNSAARFICNCQMGLGRSTIASSVLFLIKRITSVGYTPPPAKFRCFVLYKFVRLLNHGNLAMNDVEDAIITTGVVYNLQNELISILQSLVKQRNIEEKLILATKSIEVLARYLQLLSFASYLRDYYANNRSLSYEDFTNNNPGMQNLTEQLLSEEFIMENAASMLLGTEVSGENDTDRPLSRKSSLLSFGSIIKEAYFASRDHENNLLDGAPNFRVINNQNVAGLAQPTLAGAMAVVSLLRKTRYESITWISLSSEPVLLIKGKPHVIRDVAQPFQYLQEFNVGLSPMEMESIATRLKSGVLEEASQGPVDLYKETTSQSLIREAHHVNTGDISLFSEVFDGDSSVEFLSVPIIADAVPQVTAFDLLFSILDARLGKNAIVFNCEMGRARSTLGIAISLLMLKHRGEVSLVSSQEPTEVDSFASVLSLVRILKNGRHVKSEVDAAISACNSVVDLKDSIRNSWTASSADRIVGRDLEAAQRRTVNYLIRYALLICFNSYLYDVYIKFVDTSFSMWLQNRPEILLHLNNWKNDPAGALKLRELDLSNEHMEIFESRSGHVFVPWSILKCDYFVGLQNKKITPHIDGAPNYRIVDKFTVCGTAVPMKHGVENVLKQLKSIRGGDSFPPVFWTNLREEPLLYINGRPFCLRDIDNPYGNLSNTGITAVRVEAMENQLKQDVLMEALKYEGKVLVHDETEDGKLVSMWELVTEETVLTCREMYTHCLQYNGDYDVFYSRAPITDEQAPLPEIFDSLVDLLKRSRDFASPFFVYNCQMGRGRTTVLPLYVYLCF